MYLLTVIRFWRTKKEIKSLRILVRLKRTWVVCTNVTTLAKPLYDSVSDNDARTSSSPNKRHCIRFGMFTSDELIFVAHTGGVFFAVGSERFTPSADIVSDDDVRTIIAHATPCSLRTRSVWWVKIKGK